MGTKDNKNDYDEKRISERRTIVDRRRAVRFSDALGRRSGIDRRLSIN